MKEYQFNSIMYALWVLITYQVSLTANFQYFNLQNFGNNILLLASAATSFYFGIISVLSK